MMGEGLYSNLEYFIIDILLEYPNLSFNFTKEPLVSYFEHDL